MAALKSNIARPTQVEAHDLPSMGWVNITDVGDENIYFTTEDGNEYYCKVG